MKTINLIVTKKHEGNGIERTNESNEKYFILLGETLSGMV